VTPATLADLREEIAGLAGEADAGLSARYELWPSRQGRGRSYYVLRHALGRLLRRWGMRREPVREPWCGRLRHDHYDESATEVLIWAVGADAEATRAGCRHLQVLLRQSRQFAPILVTDVADFGFYARLGWLVEYIPRLTSPAGTSMYDRKLRYIAWRYRDRVALPVAVCHSLDIAFLEGLAGTRPDT